MLQEEHIKNIVKKAANGDSAAFTQLYEIYFDRVYKYIYFRIKKQSETEDLTQEVFIKAMNAIASYKIGETPFAAWLFRIAHNQIIDYARKTGRVQIESLNEATTSLLIEDPVVNAESNIEVEELMRAIETLPPAQQEVITLRFVGGLALAEVAQLLGKSIGTVKALQFNATESLKKKLIDKIR